MSTADNFRAIVVERCSRGGGNFFWPVRIYLLLCQVDADGEPVVPKRATSAPDWTYVRVNRLSSRGSALHKRANALAAKVNAGEMSFSAAKDAYLH